MKNVLSYSEFLAENAKNSAIKINPVLKIAQNIAGVGDKVQQLKQEIVESPEKEIIIKAKIGVEMAKLSALKAQKVLLNAKDFEEGRSERAKLEKLRDSERAKKAKASKG